MIAYKKINSGDIYCIQYSSKYPLSTLLVFLNVKLYVTPQVTYRQPDMDKWHLRLITSKLEHDSTPFYYCMQTIWKMHTFQTIEQLHVFDSYETYVSSSHLKALDNLCYCKNQWKMFHLYITLLYETDSKTSLHKSDHD